MSTKKGLYRTSDLIVLGVCAVIFAASAHFYFGNISIWRYLNGSAQDELSTPIGRLSSLDAEVKRRHAQESDFRPLPKESPVFNQDTIVTSDSGGAVISLDDGSQIELNPGTLIRLSYVSELSLGGVVRNSFIEVVKGQARGRASGKGSSKLILKSPGKAPVVLESRATQSMEVKAPPVAWRNPPAALPRPVPSIAPSVAPAPVASPSAEPSVAAIPSPSATPIPEAPTLLEATAPLDRASIAPGPTAGEEGAKVTLRWKTSPGLPVKLVVQPGGAEKPVLEREIKANASGEGVAEFVAQSPGAYRWSVSTGGKTVNRRFDVRRQFPGVKTSPVLVDGKNVTSSEYRGEALSRYLLSFRWTEVEDAENYRVVIEPRQGKPIALTSKDPNRDWKPAAGQGDAFRYQVIARFENGFEAVSEKQDFGFSFVTPVPTDPLKGKAIPLAAIREEGVLLAWRKTNFTQQYEAEVASDAAFTQGVRRFKPNENFVVVPRLEAGKYFWRVRGLGGAGAGSPFSKAEEFSVVP